MEISENYDLEASLGQQAVDFNRRIQHLQTRLDDATVANAKLTADLEEHYHAAINFKRLAAAVDHTAEAVVITDRHGYIQYVNPAFENVTGYSAREALGNKPSILKSGRYDSEFYQTMWSTILKGEIWSGHMTNKRKDGSFYDEEETISPIHDPASGKIVNFVAVKRDVSEQLQLKSQLQQAQKLESIGQLAAGIAHEINTPTQYVGDNTRFVKEAFDDIGTLLDTLTELQACADGGCVPVQALGEALERADVEYLRAEIPRALEQTLEGVERVANIVRAMKAFSHPGKEMTPIDLNAAIQSTLTVATSEWKYVAELNTDFDPALPAITCLPGEFNQVILNMIVNAAHAIVEAQGDSSQEKGVICVTTHKVGEWAEIGITDTGAGMPEEVKARIFDPFFTTKEVGKGTGQGLNIAYNVVVNKHAGTITVDSEPGRGTRFTIRLPINAEAA